MQQANELHEKGFTWKQSAEAIGVSDRTLYRYIDETDKTDKTEVLSLTKLTELTEPLCIMSYENDNVNVNVYDDVNANENEAVDVYAETPTESNIMPVGNPLKEKDYISDIVDFISIISKTDDTKHIKNTLSKKINSEDLSAETFFNELKNNQSYLFDYCKNSANKKDNVYYIINVTAKRIMSAKTNIQTTKPIKPLEKNNKSNNEQLEETYKKAVYDLRYFKEIFELYGMNDNGIYQVANDFRSILERKSVSDFEYNDLVNLWLSRTDNKDKNHFIQDADTAINSFNSSKYNPPPKAINESVKTFDTEYDNDDLPF